MKPTLCLLALLAVTAQAAQTQARNVILFLGDAAGIPTLHLASIARYNHPQRLFIGRACCNHGGKPPSAVTVRLQKRRPVAALQTGPPQPQITCREQSSYKEQARTPLSPAAGDPGTGGRPPHCRSTRFDKAAPCFDAGRISLQ